MTTDEKMAKLDRHIDTLGNSRDPYKQFAAVILRNARVHHGIGLSAAEIARAAEAVGCLQGIAPDLHLLARHLDHASSLIA